MVALRAGPRFTATEYVKLPRDSPDPFTTMIHGVLVDATQTQVAGAPTLAENDPPASGTAYAEGVTFGWQSTNPPLCVTVNVALPLFHAMTIVPVRVAAV